MQTAPLCRGRREVFIVAAAPMKERKALRVASCAWSIYEQHLNALLHAFPPRKRG